MAMLTLKCSAHIPIRPHAMAECFLSLPPTSVLYTVLIKDRILPIRFFEYLTLTGRVFCFSRNLWTPRRWFGACSFSVSHTLKGNRLHLYKYLYGRPHLWNDQILQMTRARKRTKEKSFVTRTYNKYLLTWQKQPKHIFFRASAALTTKVIF